MLRIFVRGITAPQSLSLEARTIPPLLMFGVKVSRLPLVSISFSFLYHDINSLWNNVFPIQVVLVPNCFSANHYFLGILV